MTARVLVVEDDDRVAAAVSASLSSYGYDVRRAADGTEGLRMAAEEPGPHLVLLDLALPDIDGIEVCRRLRDARGVPIIMVTARTSEPERVRGLRSGADDYVVKPFGLAELLARVEAVLRRAARIPSRPEVLQVSDVEIDVAARLVTVAGRPVGLTRKEFDLMVLLVRQRGRVVPRSEILRAVWDTGWAGGGRTLDTHVASLRQKLGRPEVVRTVRGVGFTVPAASPGLATVDREHPPPPTLA